MRRIVSEKNLLCLLSLMILLFALLLAGCGLEKTDNRKLKDLSYTILEEKDIPEEFLAVIEEKKENIFKLTYTDQEN